jgi:hypothetical protein
VSASATWTISEQTDPRRIRALEPYLARLRSWNEAPDAGPAQIRVGTRAVRVESWERRLLREEPTAGGSGRDDMAGLLAQGLALVAKSLVDLQRLSDAGGHHAVDLFALQADLMLDAAIGIALLRELQVTVDTLVRGGRVEDARRITEFRNRLNRLVAEVKNTISDSERRRAETLSGGLGGGDALGRLAAEIDAHVVQERAAQEKQEQETPSRSRWRPWARRRLRRAGNALRIVVPSRTSVLAAGVVMAAAVWVGLVAVPSAVVRARDPRPVAVLRTGPILGVDARAPSVYVTVEAVAWDTLGESERLRAMHDLVRGVPSEDWSGVFVRTSDGRPVARWLRSAGIALLHPVEVPQPEAPVEFVGPLP